MNNDKQQIVAPRGADPAIERLLKHCHKHSYGSKQILIRNGQEQDTLFYLLDGSVSVTVDNREGQEMVLDYLHRGDFFGENGLFEGNVRSVSVMTREASEIAQIHYSNFRRLCQEDPDILFQLAGQLSRRLRKANRKLARSAFIDVTSRIAYALMELARQPEAMSHPDGTLVKISRQEIGRLIGCSREMASRAVKELETQGFISAHGKSIILLGAWDPAKTTDRTSIPGMYGDDSLISFEPPPKDD